MGRTPEQEHWVSSAVPRVRKLSTWREREALQGQHKMQPSHQANLRAQRTPGPQGDPAFLVSLRTDLHGEGAFPHLQPLLLQLPRAREGQWGHDVKHGSTSLQIPSAGLPETHTEHSQLPAKLRVLKGGNLTSRLFLNTICWELFGTRHREGGVSHAEPSLILIYFSRPLVP